MMDASGRAYARADNFVRFRFSLDGRPALAYKSLVSIARIACCCCMRSEALCLRDPATLIQSTE